MGDVGPLGLARGCLGTVGSAWGTDPPACLLICGAGLFPKTGRNTPAQVMKELS